MKLRVLAVGLALGLVCSVGWAATLNLTATPVARFDDAFNPLPFNNTTDPGTYQVDLAFSISDLQAGERGWGGLGLDVGLTNLMDTIGWQGDTSTVDSNGALPGGIVPKYATNLDAGPSATDLQRITVAIPSGLTNDVDPRTRIGNPGPDLIGSLFVKYGGTGLGTLAIQNLGFLVTNPDGSLNTTEFPAVGPTVTFGGDGDIPPDIQTINLGATTLAVINQALDAGGGTPPITWSGLQSTAGSPALAATLTPEGQFQWATEGSARGPVGSGILYSWTATATNAAGADTDIALTLMLEIPEPATMSLFGLAMIGVVGLLRRRS